MRLVLLSLVLATLTQVSGKVTVLADVKSFDAFIKEKELSLLEFYAPWCGHCKKLSPEYDAAALALVDTGISLAKVDCTTEPNKPICERYGVKGFPTLKVFRNTDPKPADYNGGRTSVDIVKYMKKQNSPAYVELKVAKELEIFRGADVAVVGSFGKLEGAAYEIFLQIATANREDFDFAYTADLASLLPEDSGVTVPAGDSIVLFKTFDDGHAIFSGEISSLEVMEFIKAESFPLLGPINADTYAKYMERNLPIMYFFIDPSATEATAAITADAKAIAVEFKGTMSLVTLDGVKWEKFMSGTFGLAAPPGSAIQFEKKIFKYQGDITVKDDLQKFAQGYVDGTIEPFLKSQEAPVDNSGPVTVIVGKEFEKIVLDETKDVFMEFYAPWCGHCKKLTPIYEEVGKHYLSDTNVVIGKCDSTENDTPAEVSGFPTLIFYPSTNKAGVKFSGDRTKEAIIKFIDDGRTSDPSTPAAGHEEL